MLNALRLDPTALAVVLVVTGCSGGASPAAPPPQAAGPRPASPPVLSGALVGAPPRSPAPAACAEPPPESPGLIVANESGVREVDPNGRELRTLSRTPAAFPRYLPGRREIVFLVPERGELRRMSLDTCAERAVATLPRDAGLMCGGTWSEPYDPVSYIHFDEDFVVDRRGELACARVMDRNLNMSNVHVVLQVQLGTGTQASQVTFPDTCAEAQQKTTSISCVRVLEEVHPPDAGTYPGPPTQALPFSVVDAQSTLPAKGAGLRSATRVALTEPTLESASASGRWTVLRGNLDEGDYIHRELFLFDRQTGQVFPLRAGPWPAALSATVLGNKEALVEAGLKATGETTVRWIGEGDTLLVGGLLIAPGRRAVQLQGALAW